MMTIRRHAPPHVRQMLIFMGKSATERKRQISEQRRLQRTNYENLRRAVEQRDGRKCAMCGATHDLVLDHKHPVSKGGKTELRNLQFLCRKHDQEKANELRRP